MQVEKKQVSAVWSQRLGGYQNLLDERIREHAAQALNEVRKEYGPYSADVVQAYYDMLNRGGKRIRGALTMVGYEMVGGTDRAMILDAAMALEMLHTYMLIVDDFQDRSDVRRGGPSVHRLLEAAKPDLATDDDREHLGASLAWNAALYGSHAAQLVLATLPVEPELKLRAISNINSTLLITAHGQTNDIINELRADVGMRSVQDVMLWKTAHYTFLNPLQVGMILGGSEQEQLEAIKDYAINAGFVFQITDDILGTFGDQFESGKSPMDDLREGKRTLLTVYALENAPVSDRNFLIQTLGNEQLTELEFKRCRELIRDCGALEYAQSKASDYCAKALAALKAHQYEWKVKDTEFLAQLVEYLLERRS